MEPRVWIVFEDFEHAGIAIVAVRDSEEKAKAYIEEKLKHYGTHLKYEDWIVK